ncbi:hypothetical protein DFH09DRAFT_1402269 [Mycena vulgaris]|nr:hypothetical protein DFH09DRAFT_1402269 [Mycena vulgaris]
MLPYRPFAEIPTLTEVPLRSWVGSEGVHHGVGENEVLTAEALYGLLIIYRPHFDLVSSPDFHDAPDKRTRWWRFHPWRAGASTAEDVSSLEPIYLLSTLSIATPDFILPPAPFTTCWRAPDWKAVASVPLFVLCRMAALNFSPRPSLGTTRPTTTQDLIPEKRGFVGGAQPFRPSSSGRALSAALSELYKTTDFTAPFIARSLNVDSKPSPSRMGPQRQCGK